MSKRLTIKQRQFVKKYVEQNGNGTKAAMVVYNTSKPQVAQSIASENLSKPMVRKAIELALERAGLTDDSVSELLREATVAGLGEKATNSDSLRGIDMLLRLKDAYPTQKTAHLRVDVTENYNKMTIKELKEELKRIQGENKKLLKRSEPS